jgi:nucleoside-diphosphate-sugar epimerase
MGIDGLIGCTGFVGGNLLRQHDFAKQFNSRNIADSKGATFDMLVCAAAPGSMFEANTTPDKDLRQIESLCNTLAEVRSRRFVLISSIAVLDDFAGGDDESSGAFQTELAYGRHRRLLETFCAEHFAETLIVRLPALFGTGLKKNFLFDLLNPVPSMLNGAKMEQALSVVSAQDAEILRKVYSLNDQNGMFVLSRSDLRTSAAQSRIETTFGQHALTAVQFTNPDSTYQYYGVDRLWSDIETASAQGIRVLHLATEPIAARQIHRIVTDHDMPQTGARLHHEDMHTRHADLWGRSGPYMESAQQVEGRIAAFCQNQREAA